jgi:glyoxylase-like metal-dependent hydrolase (beta-lactamase superfamily II)
MRLLLKRKPVTTSEPSSPDASLIADESYTETSAAGLTYPWGKSAPASGQTITVAKGVQWARIPMPGSLGHINSWIIDDDTGDGRSVAVVDTGLQLTTCSDEWKALFAGALKDTPITRVICTHLHPDHIGLAGWLCKRFDAPLFMTRSEFLTARMLIGEASDTVPDAVSVMRRAAGWSDEDVEAAAKQGWGRFTRVVFPLPTGYQRIVDGDTLSLGGQNWRIVVGSGHSPEHACLWNEAEGVLISGDQVLPRISSNVSINATEPYADPLGEWLASIDKLLTALPDDVLVCPAHGEPFKGLHIRLKALRDEHLSRLDAVHAALAKPHRVVDCFPLLFKRTIGPEHRELATGEAAAHLRTLETTGRARREMQDGVNWYYAV